MRNEMQIKAEVLATEKLTDTLLHKWIGNPDIKAEVRVTSTGSDR
jgi:hypothetical protein